MLQVHDTAVDITNIDSIRTRPVEGGIEGEKVMEGMGAMGGMDLERDDHFYVVNDLDAVHDVQVRPSAFICQFNFLCLNSKGRIKGDFSIRLIY